METRKQRCLQIIIEKLSVYKNSISMNNAISLYDLNISAEDFVCGLLNMVYGLNLVNLNQEEMNYPGIDLGDAHNRVAVQVTSDNSKVKVQKTLDAFVKHSYIDGYNRLVIFVLGDKLKFKANFVADPLSFSKENDILDFNDIIKEINCLESYRIEAICGYLEQELVMHNGELSPAQADIPETNAGTVGNDFAKGLNSAMAQRAESVYTKVQRLKNRFYLDYLQIRKIKKALIEIHSDMEKIIEYDAEISLSQNAFLFIQSLDKAVLKWLYDIGIDINIQVVEGLAQGYAEEFFDKYFRYASKELDYKHIEFYLFGGYTFEQIYRIVCSYEKILDYEPNKLGFSTGYIGERAHIGNILAASVSGKSNKIYVWDIDTRNNQPIAVLAGLFEQVRKVKIIRVQDAVYVVARGTRQIYLWDLKSKTSAPISVYRAENGIICYDIYRSHNKKLYIIATGYKKIYLWELGGKEKPTFELNIDNKYGDAFIFKTEVEQGNLTYHILGDSADSCNTNNKIYLLKECQPLEFDITYLCDEIGMLGSLYDKDEFGFGIDSYQIVPDLPILGVLTRKTLFLYNIQQRKKVFTMWQKGQQINDFKIISDKNGDIYLLIYYLYISHKDDGKGMVRCYCIRDGRVIDEQECFHSNADMRKAVIVREKDDINIFFNRNGDNTIYTTSYDTMDKYGEFYTLPGSTQFIDMASG